MTDSTTTSNAPVMAVFMKCSPDAPLEFECKLWKNPKKSGKGFTISGKSIKQGNHISYTNAVFFNKEWKEQNKPAVIKFVPIITGDNGTIYNFDDATELNLVLQFKDIGNGKKEPYYIGVMGEYTFVIRHIKFIPKELMPQSEITFKEDVHTCPF